MTLGGHSSKDSGIDNLINGSFTSTQRRIERHMQQQGHPLQALTADSRQNGAPGGLSVISPTLDIKEELSILQSRVTWSPARQLPAAMVVIGPSTPDMSTSSAECLAGLSAPRASNMPLQHCFAAASEHGAQLTGAAAGGARVVSHGHVCIAASGRHAAFQRSASQVLECMTPRHAQSGPMVSGQPALRLHSQGGSNLQKHGEIEAPATASPSPSDVTQGVRARRPPSLPSVADAQPRVESL